jgi:nucleoside-triphosphatase
MVSTLHQDDELKVVLLTGAPGVGKTTTVTRVCSFYSAKGMSIQGITTHEIRENGQRIGFKVTDIATGKEGWLARKDSSTGPRIGSYYVVSEDLENIGVRGLERAVEGPAHLVIVDEIGPMEMTSSSFRNVISRVLKAERPTVVTVRLGSQYTEVERIRPQSIQMEITKDNREEIYRKLIGQIDEWTKQDRS